MAGQNCEKNRPVSSKRKQILRRKQGRSFKRLRLLADKMTNTDTEGVATAEIEEIIAIIAKICKERPDATQNRSTTSRGEMEEIRDGEAATETIAEIGEISAKETETSTSSVVIEVVIAILDLPFKEKILDVITTDNLSRSL